MGAANRTETIGSNFWVNLGIVFLVVSAWLWTLAVEMLGREPKVGRPGRMEKEKRNEYERKGEGEESELLSLTLCYFLVDSDQILLESHGVCLGSYRKLSWLRMAGKEPT